MAKKKRKKASPKATAKATRKTCFTVMPFGGWFDDYYTAIFVPAINDAGLEAERADDLYGPSAIINDIWTMTRRSAIVLADLTGKNANVFYELGLAHAVAKPAVLVTASLEDVPFDLKSLRVIVYDKNDPNWGEDLRTAITKALRETLERPAESVLPTFLGNSHASTPPAPKGENLELLQIRQELRSLRNQISHSSVSESPIGPVEARDLVAQYLERGYPPSIIQQRLQQRGVPQEWIAAEIRRARTKSGDHGLFKRAKADSTNKKPSGALKQPLTEPGAVSPPSAS